MFSCVNCGRLRGGMIGGDGCLEQDAVWRRRVAIGTRLAAQLARLQRETLHPIPAMLASAKHGQSQLFIWQRYT